jgi:hypothetical protein
MNTFLKTSLKVLLVLLAAVLLFKLLPVLAIPLFLAIGIILGIGGLLAGGLALAATALVATVLSLCVVALAVVGVLSPIWLPVLAIFGVVVLVRKLSHRDTVVASA